MKAAHAIFAFILVLFPLGVLAPIIGNEKMDLPDLHPQNFNMPRKGAVTYANPRDPQGRPGLELLQGGPGDLAYGDESAVSPGTVSPGASVTISGRVGGWDVNDFTLAEVTVYIFWNTNITTPSSWVNSPPYNGITIENGTAAVTSNQTNGTAEPASGGIPLNYDYTEAGFFEATFNITGKWEKLGLMLLAPLNSVPPLLMRAWTQAAVPRSHTVPLSKEQLLAFQMPRLSLIGSVQLQLQ
ncbi:MAG: hypothetical protein ACXACI_13755 [Candidatus Hodarchaeales archaeon]